MNYVFFRNFVLIGENRRPNNRRIVNLQDNLDKNDTNIHENNSMDSIEIIYTKLLPSLRVRTNNVLSAWRQEYQDFTEYIMHFLSASMYEISFRRNCGKQTIREIINFREKLLQQSSYTVPSKPISGMNNSQEEKQVILPCNIDEVLPLFLTTLDGLSSRSKNRIIQLLKECNNSLSTFYKRICDPDCIESIPAIGRKSKPEIQDFFIKAKAFLGQFPDEESVSSRMKSHLISAPSVLGLPDGAMDFLLEKEDYIGHFPLFAAIQLYFKNRPDDEKALIEGCMLIHQGQELPDRGEVAAALNLSTERVRQKRNNLITKLTSYFSTYSKLGFITENPYRFQMTHIEDEINALEGTDFNLNFVCWVLGSVFDDLTTIGDITKSIGGYFDIDLYLCIVPTNLTKVFNFDSFLQDMDNRIQEKRINEEKIKLSHIINSNLIVQYCDDDMPMIDTTCRTILYLHYPVEVDQGYIILPANSYKTNQVILEEILRANGKPMTLAEIAEEYMYQYPERDATENSLRGAINGNNNIVPIGRSSTYTLREWVLTEQRGGTIRSFVKEFIDSTPEKIARTASIAEYILQFRPDTNEQSIVSNICLDPDKTFKFFYKDGERYFGYTEMTYPEAFFPLESDFRTASTNSFYFPKFLEFVKTHHRFPFTSGMDKEEHALRSFWRRQESRYNKGILDDHAAFYFEKIMKEYGHYKIDKCDYDWRVQFVHAAKEYGFPYEYSIEFLDVVQLEDTETWLKRNLGDYYYRQGCMPSWKIEQMRPFAEFLKNKKENVQDNLG